ncbi:hypothetical protein [Xanthomonas sp. 3075]|uniref:hypothetical protein n=1 Tax=Xanthomonas sp. 3075 TaxID=3035315 RepID=UPI0017A52D7E|nr:hypothetical protein [Xanthomonas sp. 3075]MBB4130645.1 hypothetical protein [Xanthomonas sp. 3075]
MVAIISAALNGGVVRSPKNIARLKPATPSRPTVSSAGAYARARCQDSAPRAPRIASNTTLASANRSAPALIGGMPLMTCAPTLNALPQEKAVRIRLA